MTHNSKDHAKTGGQTSAIFIKFAEVPAGVQIVASSDAAVRRLRNRTFTSYDAGCEAMFTRIGKRAHQPSSLVCQLIHY